MPITRPQVRPLLPSPQDRGRPLESAHCPYGFGSGVELRAGRVILALQIGKKTSGLHGTERAEVSSLQELRPPCPKLRLPREGLRPFCDQGVFRMTAKFEKCRVPQSLPCGFEPEDHGAKTAGSSCRREIESTSKYILPSVSRPVDQTDSSERGIWPGHWAWDVTSSSANAQTRRQRTHRR